MPQKYINPFPWTDEVRRRAGNSRSNWPSATPEPTPTSKHVYYTIGDVEVDAETWNKYSQRDYDLGGGVPITLRGVQLRATSKEMAALDPAEAAEAKRIIAKIVSEITGKGVKNMNKPNTAKEYMDALKEVYNESRASYVDLQKKLDEAKRKLDAATKDFNTASGSEKQLNEALMNSAQQELRATEEYTRRERRNILGAFNSKTRKLREEFSSFLDGFYSAAPENLDNATVELLRSGICTPREMLRFSEANSGNPTMLRVIGSYAEKMLTSRSSPEDKAYLLPVTQRAAAAQTGDREMRIFDDAAAVLQRGIGDNPGVSDKMHETFCEGRWPEFLSNMESLSGSGTPAPAEESQE